MEIRIAPLNAATVNKLEAQAAESTCWELEWENSNQPRQCLDPAFDKQLWIQRVLLEWGVCGFTALVGTGEDHSKLLPAASTFFAPASYFPGYATLPSGPFSPDALVLSHVYVSDAYMGLYLEHLIIDAVIKEARSRGVKAIETFGRIEEFDDEVEIGLEGGAGVGNKNEEINSAQLTDARDPFRVLIDIESNPVEEAVRSTQSLEAQKKFVEEAYGGWSQQRAGIAGDQLSAAPLLSEDILLDQGFKLVQEHSQYPRYRYEVESSSSLFAAREHEDDYIFSDHTTAWPTVIGGQRKVSAHAKSLSTLFQRGQRGK